MLQPPPLDADQRAALARSKQRVLAVAERSAARSAARSTAGPVWRLRRMPRVLPRHLAWAAGIAALVLLLLRAPLFTPLQTAAPPIAPPVAPPVAETLLPQAALLQPVAAPAAGSLLPLQATIRTATAPPPTIASHRAITEPALVLYDPRSATWLILAGDRMWTAGDLTWAWSAVDLTWAVAAPEPPAAAIVSDLPAHNAVWRATLHTIHAVRFETETEPEVWLRLGDGRWLRLGAPEEAPHEAGSPIQAIKKRRGSRRCAGAHSYGGGDGI